MKKILKKTLSVFLAVVLAAALLPLNAVALPTGLEFDLNSKELPDNLSVRTPETLSDGEVYTYTTVTGISDTGDSLPFTDFTVGLSAIGQQYPVTTTTTYRYNIVFLLDVSNSMDGTRMTNMIQAANGAIDQLYGNDNKIAIISFATAPAVERALSTKDLDLISSGSTNTSGTVDKIKIGLRSYSLGGTNIQAGLNESYNVLNNANDPDAIPIIILLSDGAPTYYYRNLTEFRTGSTGRTGTGSSSGAENAAYTIAQAAYIKLKLQALQIYTIPFSLSTSDSDYNTATATLSPTAPNLSRVSNFPTYWNTAINSLSPEQKSAMQVNYPDATYSASNSTSSLSSALSNIITKMNMKNPIREKEKETGGLLDSASYLWIRYQLGTGYNLLGNAMTVTLNETNYTMTNHDGNYTYDSPTSAPAYNEKLTRLVITVSDTGLVTWKIPANVLPCNTPEGETQVLAVPITLSFAVRFNENADWLTAGVYSTQNSCEATFTPTSDNPYYYNPVSTTSSEQLDENITTTYDVTTYYKATYPYPNHNNYGKPGYGLPTLTGFATGASQSGVTFIDNPASVPVTGYADNSNDTKDVLTVSYDSQTLNLNNVSRKTASATFSVTDLNDVSTYSVSNFNDGFQNFADARITAVNDDGITVGYDGCKRSVTFKNKSFTATTNYASTNITIQFLSTNGRNPNPNSISVNTLKVNGTIISSESSITGARISGTYTEWLIFSYNYYDIDVLYNGVTYTCTNVPFNSSTSSNKLSPWMDATIASPGFLPSNKSQSYYFAEGSGTVTLINEIENFRLVYTAATQKLDVMLRQNGVLGTQSSYTADANTAITANPDGGYKITQYSNGGLTKTVTVYSISDNILTMQTSSVTGKNGINMTNGTVTHLLSSSGALTIKSAITAGECVPSATLKSLSGTGVATATSSGVAYVVLNLTVAETVNITDINLGNTANADHSAFSANVTSAVKVVGSGTQSILTGGALPSSFSPGNYKITFATAITYADAQNKPDSYHVRLESLGVTHGATASSLVLEHHPTYEDQQVMVVLMTPSGH